MYQYMYVHVYIIHTHVCRCWAIIIINKIIYSITHYTIITSFGKSLGCGEVNLILISGSTYEPSTIKHSPMLYQSPQQPCGATQQTVSHASLFYKYLRILCLNYRRFREREIHRMKSCHNNC